MNVHVLQNGERFPGISHVRSGVYPLRGKVTPEDFDVAAVIEAERGPARDGAGRLVRAWAQPRSDVGNGKGKISLPHDGFDYGIRAPEAGETAPCWDEIVMFLRIGAHEADA